MRKLLFIFLVLVLYGICHADSPVAERPIYSAGDYWIFVHEDGKEVKIEFLREEKDQYVFNKNGTQLIKDFNLTSIKEKGRGGYLGPIIQFPLKIGKWWKYEYEAEYDVTKKDIRRIAKYEVEAYEQITVPSGTFWAFKITVTKENIKGKFKGSAHYWYATDVKQIIKSSEEGRLSELKEYKIK